MKVLTILKYLSLGILSIAAAAQFIPGAFAQGTLSPSEIEAAQAFAKASAFTPNELAQVFKMSVRIKTEVIWSSKNGGPTHQHILYTLKPEVNLFEKVAIQIYFANRTDVEIDILPSAKATKPVLLYPLTLSEDFADLSLTHGGLTPKTRVDLESMPDMTFAKKEIDRFFYYD